MVVKPHNIPLVNLLAVLVVEASELTYGVGGYILANRLCVSQFGYHCFVLILAEKHKSIYPLAIIEALTSKFYLSHSSLVIS